MAATDLDLGTAWVAIAPSMRGVKKAVESELKGVDVASASRGWGDSIKSAVGGAFKTAAAVGVASIGALGASVAGLAIKGGIDRALAIEGAEAKLTGLGHSAESVEQIMGSALASVKGTAFGLGEAATVAASMSASGIEAGEELTMVLTTIADTAQISGRSMEDVGAIFGSVAARGKLQGDDLLQLTSAGIPALQFLAEELGVTSGEISEMVSKGEIDFATFASAMEAGLGGAALSAGETFTGAWANVQAALSRGGAQLMTPILDGLRVVFNALIPVIDQATGALEPFAAILGEKVGEAAEMVAAWLGTIDFEGFAASMSDWFASIDLSAVAGWFSDIGSVVSDLFSTLTSSGLESGIPGLEEGGAAQGGLTALGGAFGDLLSHAPELLGALGDLAASVLPAVTTVVGFLADNMDTVIAALPLIVGGVLAWVGASKLATSAQQSLLAAQTFMLPVAVANNTMRFLAARAERQLAAATVSRMGATVSATAADGASAATKSRGVIATIAHRAATIGSTVATKTAAAAQWAMNAAMNANPIGIIILAIVALVGALIWFFTQTELGQQIWENVVNAISTAWTWLWESVLKPTFDAIGAVFTWLYENVIKYVIAGVILYFEMWGAIFTWLWENIVSPVFEAIGAIFSWIYENVIRPIIAMVVLHFKILGAIFTWLWENAVQPTFAAIGAIFEWLYQNVISPIITGVVLYFQMWGAIFTWLWQNIISPTFTAIGAIFTWLYENIIRPVWSGIQAAIQVVADWIGNTLWPGIEKTLGFMGQGFQLLKDTITEVWENIKKAAVAPINFVINTVYNDGIKKLFDQVAEAVGLDERLPAANAIAFAAGGVIPGYTPGRDVHRFFSPTAGWLDLSGGEGIIRPDTLRSLGGKPWLDRVNAARGNAGSIRGFAEGGIWDDIVGGVEGALDWVSSAAGSVAEIISNPLGAIDRLILEPVKDLLAGIGGGFLGQMVTQMPLQWIEGIKSWFSTLVEPAASGGVNADGTWHGGNTLQRLLPIIQKYGLMITDTYRTKAQNDALGSGEYSYHRDYNNPAVDIAGPFAVMDAFAAEVAAMGGWRQLLWKVAGHWDHVHVAREGGVWPTFDAGGWLMPGLQTVYNGTGQPEPVFTSEQWSLIERYANTGGMPDHVYLVDENGELIARVRAEASDVAIKAGKEAGVW